MHSFILLYCFFFCECFIDKCKEECDREIERCLSECADWSPDAVYMCNDNCVFSYVDCIGTCELAGDRDDGLLIVDQGDAEAGSIAESGDVEIFENMIFILPSNSILEYDEALKEYAKKMVDGTVSIIVSYQVYHEAI